MTNFATASLQALLIGFMFLTSATMASTLAPFDVGSAPALALKDLEGREHHLADYRGKVVLVNFWATWCEPCRQEMPSIQRLSAKLSGKPFVVLAVNVDEPAARIRKFLMDTGFDQPVLLDVNKSVTKQWSARVLPVTFIVGPDGRLRYRLLGEMDWSSQSVVTLIAGLMAGG
jgi:cytochrome c biogenesis protein CcmG, thiol:disulfide interchange protein DsbE